MTVSSLISNGVSLTRSEPAPACEDSSACLIDRDHPLRAAVEEFIAARFLAVHGARLSSFLPTLVALFDQDGAVRAAVGVRDAGEEALFLEHYLDSPIEQAIACSAASAAQHPRERIVEIGNLASRDRRASRQLFIVLAQLLREWDFEWAVFTGCSSLQRMFGALGIQTFELGRALQSRLPTEEQTWGSYYEDSPRVVAGRVSRGFAALSGSVAPGNLL